jgi:D-3-phosphoglycerate dehydrogenase
MATVLVTHPADRLREYFGDEALARLQRIAQVRLNPSNADLSGPALVQAAQGCQLMIAYRQTSLDAASLQAMPELLAVVRCAVDIRTIDVPAASGQGILVTRASAGFMASVSEWILAVMIDLSRGISRAAAVYSAGRQPVPQMGRELRGATLGVIGYGQISRYLCPLAAAFGLRVLVNDPFLPAHEAAVRSTDLADLLAQSDYVVCLAPANAETENLMNAAAFARMKQGAFFVKTASRWQGLPWRNRTRNRSPRPAARRASPPPASRPGAPATRR